MSVIDVGDWAPNVVIDQLGSGYGPTLAASVRGLGYGDFKATSEPTMTIYVDDVVLGRPTGAVLDLLDLERVEVLRGPARHAVRQERDRRRDAAHLARPGEGGTRRRRSSSRPATTTGSTCAARSRPTLVEDKVFARVSYVAKQRDGWQDIVDFSCADDRARHAAARRLQRRHRRLERSRRPERRSRRPRRRSGRRRTASARRSWASSAARPTTTSRFRRRTSARGTDEGCVVDTLGEENVQAARGVLRFIASDRFEMNFAADVTDQESESPYDLLTAGESEHAARDPVQQPGRDGELGRSVGRAVPAAERERQLRGLQRPVQHRRRYRDSEHQRRAALGRQHDVRLDARQYRREADPRAPRVRRAVGPRLRRVADADQPYARHVPSTIRTRQRFA